MTTQWYRRCPVAFITAVLFLWIGTVSRFWYLPQFQRFSTGVSRQKKSIVLSTTNTNSTDDIITHENESPFGATNATATTIANDTASKIPRVVWLMSFPNSGTTYTNRMVQGVSGLTSATNYGKEQSNSKKNSISFLPDQQDGPFLRHPDWNYSTSYILTKTHCGGYCVQCNPQKYVISAERFERDCRSGNKMVNGKLLQVRPAYPSSLLAKAVHVIRNPYDNIVARLHKQRKDWVHQGGHDQYLNVFESSVEGFHKWCQYLNDTSAKATFELSNNGLDNTTKSFFHLVPCSSEFYRWVQWHNYAVQITDHEHLKLPVHRIYYENYEDSYYNQTVKELLEFLELPVIHKPPIFIEGKTYPDYFTTKERYYAKQLVQHLASNETWQLLSHYFDDV